MTGTASSFIPAPRAETTIGLSEADSFAGQVLSCPGVAALSDAARTYLPGRTVPGIVLEPDHVQVHVVLQYGTPVKNLVAQLAWKLSALMAGRALTVHVQDITMPGTELTSPISPGPETIDEVVRAVHDELDHRPR